MRNLADKTAEQILAHDVDVVLTVGQGYLVFWDSPLPAATFSDILYGSVSLEGFEHEKRKPRQLNSQQGQQLSDYAQRAVDNALRVFVTSSFVLEGARDFGTVIPPEKGIVTQIGANFRDDFVPSMVAKAGPPPLKLLWLGTDWNRKNGDRALSVFVNLVEQGLAVELHLIGDVPEAVSRAGVFCHGFLRKDVAAEQERLLQVYEASHLMLLPTEKDFTPSALAEAAAFGIPAVTTPVGGLPEMFEEDEVVLVPFEHYQEAAVKAIMALLEDGRLLTMAERVRRRFETTLNWDVIARKIVNELAVALEQ
jgi:glycosyltransferase involved in cell wall biosynthesis